MTEKELVYFLGKHDPAGTPDVPALCAGLSGVIPYLIWTPDTFMPDVYTLVCLDGPSDLTAGLWANM